MRSFSFAVLASLLAGSSFSHAANVPNETPRLLCSVRFLQYGNPDPQRQKEIELPLSLPNPWQYRKAEGQIEIGFEVRVKFKAIVKSEDAGDHYNVWLYSDLVGKEEKIIASTDQYEGNMKPKSGEYGVRNHLYNPEIRTRLRSLLPDLYQVGERIEASGFNSTALSYRGKHLPKDFMSDGEVESAILECNVRNDR